MKVSVITACYNSSETLEATILSVIGQNYPDKEYIIIDGGSTDATASVISKYRELIQVYVSEKDNGIYDALNKGIGRASGDIIAILHADDVYADDQVLSDVMKQFAETGSDSVYGDLQYVDRQDVNRIIRNWKSGQYHDGLFLKGWMPPHPSFFLKKSCYDRYGTFNTTLKSAADYELMLRMLHRHKISTSYLRRVLVKMRTGGVSNASLKNRIRANREDRMAWKINGLRPGLLTLIRKPLSKIRQYFNR